MTSLLRRLPPLPGEVITWPTSTTVLAAQASLDLEPIPQPSVDAAALAGHDAVRARAGRFALAVVETLSGDRPASQLERWMTPAAFDDVAALTATTNRRTDSGARARTERPRLLSVHVSQPAQDVAEVCGHVSQGRRSRAVALRLEKQGGQWVCTALQVG